MSGEGVVEQRRGDLLVSTDPALLQIDVLHAFLSRSYWAEGIPRQTLERAIRNSLCFGLYDGADQAGFARVVTDRATYAYLADVFVLESHRGRGLARWLIECIRAHPDLQGLRRWGLVTRDAQGLYRKLGFRELRHPERFMEIHDPSVYRGPSS